MPAQFSYATRDAGNNHACSHDICLPTSSCPIRIDHLDGDAPRSIPVKALLVDEQPHELRDGNGRVRVVHLEDRLLRQQRPVTGVLSLEPRQHILTKTPDTPFRIYLSSLQPNREERDLAAGSQYNSPTLPSAANNSSAANVQELLVDVCGSHCCASGISEGFCEADTMIAAVGTVGMWNLWFRR